MDLCHSSLLSSHNLPRPRRFKVVFLDAYKHIVKSFTLSLAISFIQLNMRMTESKCFKILIGGVLFREYFTEFSGHCFYSADIPSIECYSKCRSTVF
jgi:hypothetical protein